MRLEDGVERVLARVSRLSNTQPLSSAELERLAPRLRESVANPEYGALHIRRQLDRLIRIVQVAGLSDTQPLAELVAKRHGLVPGWDAETDLDYSELIDRVLGEDV